MLGGVGLDRLDRLDVGASERAPGKWRIGTVGSSPCSTVVVLDPGAV
jgi:hypothetical protein